MTIETITDRRAALSLARLHAPTPELLAQCDRTLAAIDEAIAYYENRRRQLEAGDL